MLNSLNIEQRREKQRERPRGSEGKDHSGPFRLPFECNSVLLKGLTEKGVVACPMFLHRKWVSSTRLRQRG